jgi:hypothetical protein
MDIGIIKKLYVVDKWTLRRIADKFGTNHHKIKKLLISNGVQINKKGQNRKPLSDGQKQKLSESMKGRIAWNKGLKANNEWILKNMVAHWKYDIDIKDLVRYEDIEKLKFLNRIITRNRKDFNKEGYLIFLDKFYNDKKFNKLYSLWIVKNKNKWYMPSLDHKIAKANGGGFNLDNLHFITWFENRAKADMNLQEWIKFKKETNTKSDLFI